MHGAHAASLRRSGAGARAARQQRVPALRRGRSRPAASGAAVPGMRHAACCHRAFAGRPRVRCARRAGRPPARAACAQAAIGRIDRERGEDARLYGRFCNHGRRREVRGVQARPRGRERAALRQGGARALGRRCGRCEQREAHGHERRAVPPNPGVGAGRQGCAGGSDGRGRPDGRGRAPRGRPAPPMAVQILERRNVFEGRAPRPSRDVRGRDRFKAYYEAVAPGAAEFLRDAIKAYCA